MKHAEALLIGILIATLTGLSYGATVTPGSDRTNIDHGPATLDDDFELKQSQGKRTVTTYPAGTTSSARGGDTVSLTSTDFCGTGTNAIVCTGTDSKVSTAVLPTNVVTSTATGTSTANVLPKMDGNGGLTLSRLFDNGTDIGIGTTAPLGKIELRFSGFNRLNPLNSYLNPLNSVMIHDIENGPNQGAGLTFASYDTVDLSYVGKIVNTRIADSTSRRLDFIIRPGVNTATFATSDIKLSILDNGNATLYGQMSVTGETLRGSTSGSISRKASATGGATTLVEPSAPPAAVGQVLAVSSLATTGTATNTATLSWKAVLGEDATLSTRPPLAIASTGTITETVTNTDTGTNTGTGTVSGSATATATNTATATASATRSGSATFTRTNTFTTTGTYTFSGTGNGVDAFSVTLTTTTTGTVTGTATVTMTGTATATAGSGTGTVTSTVSATSTATSSATATQTVMSPGTADRYTITRAKTATSTGTVTLTEYVTISLTGTNTASGSGTVTATVTGTTTATATGTASGTWSGTSTSTATQTTTGTSTNAATGQIADGLTITSNPMTKAISPFTIRGNTTYGGPGLTTSMTCGQLPASPDSIGCGMGEIVPAYDNVFLYANAFTTRLGSSDVGSTSLIAGDESDVVACSLKVDSKTLTCGGVSLVSANLNAAGEALGDVHKTDTITFGQGDYAFAYRTGTDTTTDTSTGTGTSCPLGRSCTAFQTSTTTTTAIITNSVNGKSIALNPTLTYTDVGALSPNGVSVATPSLITSATDGQIYNSRAMISSDVTGALGYTPLGANSVSCTNADSVSATNGQVTSCSTHSITANTNPVAVTYDSRGRVTGAQSITPAWIGALPSTTAHVVNIDSHYSTNSYSAAPGNCVTLTSAAVTASTNATYMTVQATASLRSAHSSPARCGIKILVNGSAGPQWGYAREEAHFMSLAASGYYVGSSGTTYTYTLQMCALDDTHTCSLDATSASTWEHASITVQLYGY